ncbi:MAG: MCP four helix bundle domain-containing protein, partial [Candidatus Saccharibacteria bacterium]|nr:MCP four helix bundle domain-containing protein [Rhodoferax sp.]
MKLTVAKKMILLAGSALLGIMLLTGLGQQQINKVYEGANYANINTVPSLVLLDDIRKNYLRTRIQITRHILNDNDAAKAEIEEILNKNRQAVFDLVKKYLGPNGCGGQACAADDKDKAYAEEIGKLFTEFDAKLEPILVESRRGEAGMAKARDLLEKTLTLSEKIAGVIDDDFDYNVQLGAKASEEALATKGRAMSLSLLITALTLAAVGGTAFFVTSNLLKQLGGEPGEAAELARSVAAGDLTWRIDLKAGDTTSMMAQLSVMQKSLSEVVSSVRQGSEGVATASAEIAQGNHDLSARTESQASALEETAASMEQLSATVKQNADSARQANQLAINASTVAIKGGEVVAQVVDTMGSINTSANKIVDI